MYEIYNFGDEWQIHTRDEAFAGSFQLIMKYCLLTLEFSQEELEMAISEMTRCGHNAAHFGMWKGFIYSFNKETRKKVG